MKQGKAMKDRPTFKQQGVVLVTSLVLLVCLTMLGVTGIQRTTDDLAMAGNQREIGLMFQSAEMGLSQAEIFIVSQISNGVYDNASEGLYTVPGDETAYSRDYYEPDNWEFNSTVANTALKAEMDLADDPRYMIEYLGDRRQNPLASINVGGGYGSEQTGEIVSMYRATARGAGMTGLSFRYIQSYYGREAP